MIRTLLLVAFFSAFSAVLSSSAGAVALQGVVRDVPYVIGFRPLNSNRQPFIGQMHLNFDNGIISGRYTDLSINPGSPFANAHNIPVSGGASNGNLTLIIRRVTFRGTIKDTWMSGSATIRGFIYTFEAEQGTPGSGG